MNRLILGAVGAVLMAVLVLAGTSYTGVDVAHAQGVVDFDIDPEITGNTNSTLGTVERCVRVDGTGGFDGSADYTIDVVVAGDTLAPTAYDSWVIYEPTKVDPVSWDALIKLAGAMDMTTKASPQLSAGALYMFGGPGTAGDGTIARIELDIDFTTPTIATFSFAKAVYKSALGDHPPGDTGTWPGTGQLAINMDCLADQVDLSVDSVITAAPTDLDTSEDGTLTVTTTGTHTGGPLTDTVAATISHTVTAPAGCLVDAGATASDSWSGDLANGASHALVTDFTIHCSGPSTHQFTVDNEVELTEPGYEDPTSGNDTDQELVDVNIWAYADIGIVSFTALCPAGRMIDSDGDTALDLCTVDVSTPTMIDVEKVIHNNGPYGPVDVNLTKYASVVMGDATVDPLMDSEQVLDVPVSVATVVTEQFEVHCLDSNVGSVAVFGFHNDIYIKDAHVLEVPDTKVNSADTSLIMLCVPRFTPSFLSDIDEDDGTMGAPVDDTCIMGLPCKGLSQTIIPADVPKQPLALIQTFTPAAIDIRNGVLIANGATVGQSGFTVVAHIQTMTPGCVYGVGGVAGQTDACLDPTHPLNPEPGCGIDATGAALVPPGAHTDWAAQLFSIDGAIQAMYPGAVLWTHVVGVVPSPYTPINILTWNLGTSGYLTIGQTGDPDNDLDGLWDDVVDPDDDNDGVPDVIDTCPTTVDPTNLDGDGDGVGFVCDPDDTVAAPTDPETYLCTPYSSDTVSLGTSQGVGAPQTLRTCEAFGTVATANPHIVAAALIRADIGLVTMLYDTIECITAETDLAVELVKDENIEVGEDLESTETITVHLENGVGPTRVDVELTQVSTDRFTCVSHLVPEIGDTLHEFTVGNQYYSKLTWEEPLMAGSEDRDVYRDYTILCSEAGVFPNIEQFVVDAAVNLTDLPDGDPDTLNNTDENHVSVDSDPDVDGDGIPNDEDNCPYNPDPDQTDTDGDGIGDLCDDDDDGDGVDDGVDDCQLVAEDPDGIDDGDGCPDTDVSIDVLKDENPEVDASETTAYPIQVTVTNGNYAADVDVDLLLLSPNPPDDDPIMDEGCIVSWGDAQAGLSFVEEVIEDSANEYKLHSLLSGTLDMAADEVVVLNLTAYIHCSERCDHVDAFELAAGAAPLPPVVEESTDPTDNILKNFPDVTVWDVTDLKKVSLEVLTPADGGNINAQQTTPMTVRQIVHNNGTVAVDALDVTVVTAPADCLVDCGAGMGPTATFNWYPYLAPSASSQYDKTCDIYCSEPSLHVFELDNSIIPTTEHVRDPDDSNDSKSTTLTVHAIAQTDPYVVAVNAAAPTNNQVNNPFTVECAISANNNGWYDPANVDVNLSLTVPGDCIKDPDSDQGEQDQAAGVLNIAKSWTVTCTDPSTHVFECDGSLVLDEVHVEDTDLNNNSDDGSDSTNIWDDADIEIESFDVAAGTDAVSCHAGTQVLVGPLPPVGPLSSVVVALEEEISNAGPRDPAEVAVVKTATSMQPSVCTVSPEDVNFTTSVDVGVNFTDSEDFTITWVDDPKPPFWCEVVFTKEIDPDVTHVNDDDGASTDPVHVYFWRDTDNDGVPDDGNADGDADEDVTDNCVTGNDANDCCDDNCQDDYNPDQLDTDGDGIGDVCDDVPFHDDTVKSLMVFGPAPINIGDTMGRYMWIIAEIGNLTTHDDTVELDLTITAPPTGCTVDSQQILPGRDQFILMALEQKWVLFRVRYECPSGAPGIYPLLIELCIDHIPDAPDGDDTNEANDCQSRTKSLLIE